MVHGAAFGRRPMWMHDPLFLQYQKIFQHPAFTWEVHDTHAEDTNNEEPETDLHPCANRLDRECPTAVDDDPAAHHLRSREPHCRVSAGFHLRLLRPALP